MRRNHGATARMSDLNPHMDAGARAPAGGVARAPPARARPPRARRQRRARRRLPGRRGRCSALLADAERTFSPLARARCSSPPTRSWARSSSGATPATRVPTQIVFVPMLLLLPTPLVPLLVGRRPSCSPPPARRCAAARRSARSAARRRRRVVQRRARAGAGRASGPSAPELEHWWVYALALAAAGARATGSSTARARRGCCHGMPPRAVLPDLLMVYRVDALLFPIGLLAALAAADEPAAVAAGAAARLPAAARSRASARRACASRSSSAAPTAAPRCCCATCSRRTTSTPAATRRTSSGLTVAVAERMGLDEDTAPLRRARRAAARHRQDRRARRDHQQARAR